MADKFSLTVVNTTLKNSGTGELKTRRELFYDGAIIERGGHRFRINYERDEDHDPPWEDGDGRGIVSRGPVYGINGKKPGERVLHTNDSNHKWYFDWQGTIAKAKEEGWGISDEKRAKLQAGLLKPPTKGQIIEAAVQSEFDTFRRWLRDDWWYVGVVVTRLAEDRDEDYAPEAGELDYGHAVWGIESSDDGYLAEVAGELIQQHLREIAEEEKAAKEEAEEQERRDEQARLAILALRSAIIWSHFTDEFKLDLHLALATLAGHADQAYPPQ